jgi:putative Mg2+ transporter-C (MgtC) family protein
MDISAIVCDAKDAAAPLGLALALTFPLGLERELTGKPAGVRTHMLVALGAAAFVVAAVAHGGGEEDLRAVQGVATGIGFVGAGAIIQQRQSVHGLTTAVSLWIAAAVGVACGLREYGLALVVGVLTVVVLLGDQIGGSEAERSGARDADPEG